MAKQVIGYNVYRAADGCSEEYYGFVETLDEAKALAAKGRTLQECMYATAEAAGHCGGISAPDKSNEGEVAEWFGEDGYDCAVEVLATDSPNLMDYDTGERIRAATYEELRASVEAEEYDGGRGVIEVDGRKCYVIE